MRGCLVVGCVEYTDTSLTRLPGALVDADKMHTALCSPAIGDCALLHSQKLLSPTRLQLEDALRKLLARSDFDVFTFYFAGHGEVRNGTFYMLLRDSEWSFLSGTSLPITTLFQYINECRPRQVNIIIDACKAGGLGLDLSQALKPDLLRAGLSCAISVFAATHVDQSAGESDEGGYATQSIVDVLNGTLRTNSRSTHLDLVVVGERVSLDLASKGITQAPICWGLNLTGSSRFAKNQHASEDDLTTSSMTGVASLSPVGQKLSVRREALWRTYLEVGSSIAPTKLLHELRLTLALLDPANGETSDFLMGLTTTLSARAKTINDRFAEAQVLAVCGTALLGVIDIDTAAPRAMDRLALQLSSAVGAEAQLLEEDLAQNWRHFLSARGGFSEFGVLPMRVTRLLGYLGAANLIRDRLGDSGELYDDGAERKLVRRLVNDYGTSVVCVADAQSAELACFFGSRLSQSLAAESDALFGSLFSDFISHKGNILKAEFDGKDLFRLMWERATAQQLAERDFIARPTSMLALLLAVARSRGLEETVDPYIHELDHHALNMYIPDRLADFSLKNMRNGMNITLHVGAESALGIFTADDFSKAFDAFCHPKLSEVMERASRGAQLGAIISSLVLRDRVCWQLLDDEMGQRTL